MIEKRLIVVNGMTGQETPVRVTDGATATDVLSKLGLEGYQLALVRNRQPLQPHSDLMQAVEDRERLFAFAPMQVGGGTWDI